jgi:hypothetical protein
LAVITGKIAQDQGNKECQPVTITVFSGDTYEGEETICSDYDAYPVYDEANDCDIAGVALISGSLALAGAIDRKYFSKSGKSDMAIEVKLGYNAVASVAPGAIGVVSSRLHGTSFR